MIVVHTHDGAVYKVPEGDHWEEPAPESLFISVYDGTRLAAQFASLSVEAIGTGPDVAQGGVVRELQTPVHFHHLWAGDDRHGANWVPPAQEHFAALDGAWFDGEVRVGLVGGTAQRATAAAELSHWWPPATVAVEADEGFEMVTLAALHQFAREAHPDTPILYTHGKGSFTTGPFADAWRRNMTRHVVGRWKHCVNSLHSVDAVGCHWLTREAYPGKIFQPGIFGGNFWWANAGYLATLAPVEYQSRYAAEGWIGLGSPRVECLVNGWPNY